MFCIFMQAVEAVDNHVIGVAWLLPKFVPDELQVLLSHERMVMDYWATTPHAESALLFINMPKIFIFSEPQICTSSTGGSLWTTLSPFTLDRCMSAEFKYHSTGDHLYLTKYIPANDPCVDPVCVDRLFSCFFSFGYFSIFGFLEVGVHGRPWSTMVVHGRPWTTMVDLGRPWSTMVDHGRSWTTMVGHGRGDHTHGVT